VLWVLVVLLAIALMPLGQWGNLAWCGTLVLIGLLLARLPLLPLLRRLSIELGLILVLVAGALWQEGGSVLWQWGWLQLTTVGLTRVVSILLKAALSLMLGHLLAWTTSVADLLGVMAWLRMPPLLLAILAAMVRYGALLVDEAQTMQRAAQSRNLLLRPRSHRQLVGSLLGALFLRAHARGEQIHQAMLARGYGNVTWERELGAWPLVERLAIALTVVLTLAGWIVPHSLPW
jgi:cobalt/nickel transport system permease protein